MKVAVEGLYVPTLIVKKRKGKGVVAPSSFIYRIIRYIPTEFLMCCPYRCLAVLFLQYPKDKSGLHPM